MERTWNCLCGKPAQVSKTAQTGEYVGKGAFIVRGQRKWLDLNMKMGLGLASVNNIVMFIAGTPETIKEKFSRYVIVAWIAAKKTIANQISKFTGLPTDDILPCLPKESSGRRRDWSSFEIHYRGGMKMSDKVKSSAEIRQ